MAKQQIAIIVGSLRRESINRKIAKSICSLVSNNLECRIVEIRGLPLFDQDQEHQWTGTAQQFRQAIGAVDGVLFCTPEYNRGVPGVLKNAIDIGSRPYGQSVWDKKPAAIISASPGAIGGFGANHQLRQACVFLNMPVMQQPEAYLSNVKDDQFDEQGRLKEGPLRDIVVSLTEAFSNWVDVIAKARRLLAEDAAHAAIAAE